MYSRESKVRPSEKLELNSIARLGRDAMTYDEESKNKYKRLCEKYFPHYITSDRDGLQEFKRITPVKIDWVNNNLLDRDSALFSAIQTIPKHDPEFKPLSEVAKTSRLCNSCVLM
jgi:hypothetical protein